MSTADILRVHGFQIHSRPVKGEALWVRDRRVHAESVALKIVGQEGRTGRCKPKARKA